MSTIETFGEALPGLMLESVVDPDHPDQFCLHTWNGRRATTARTVNHNGISYISRQFVGGLAQSVRFASPSLPFGSTAKLISSLRDFLSRYARLQPEGAELLVAFALATWFCDCMPVAPVLCLFGPDDAVSMVLRLLGCACRRPVLLADVDSGGLATLPSRLGATLLINQRDLGRRVKRTLLASNQRHFCIVRGRGGLDLYGARAFSCEGSLMDDQGLKVSVSPTRDPLPFLTDAEEQVIARSLQSRLLRYRMVHYEKVRDSEVDCSAFVLEMRTGARTWLVPICDFPEFRKSVFEEILRQSRDAAAARFFDPKCLVAEAALFFCHKPDTAHFFVIELAEAVNVLLQGRHEESTVSAKRVGLLLRELALQGQRVAEGYKIILTGVVRERIHQLAFDYQVLSTENEGSRCRLCRDRKAVSNRLQ